MRKIRCAIYTRKSSEDGLEQGFNSLHAQREACAAYVLSQASEGWLLVSAAYDDGGLSGGTLERPALSRLLADIAEGRIDIVVVYKVDRLTRSLLDFAKLVEAFDAADTSFVSVTQSFNTTTSMGRLTLNMLLSFAQFEREVTAERIRDKIAASKAKGMWMGGTPPMGYRPDGRTLAIVENDAALVRMIFERYLAIGNVRLVTQALAEEGVKTPERVSLSGRHHGGGKFTRAGIYRILNNPIYAGQIRHRGTLHRGRHPAIVDQAMFDAAQTLLADHVRGERRSRTAEETSTLAGRIVDAAGVPLVASHASKKNRGIRRRYRYYVSRSTQQGDAGGAGGIRIPAPEIEALVAAQIDRFLSDPARLAEALHDISPRLIRRAAALGESLGGRLRDRNAALRKLVARVIVHDDGITVELDGKTLSDALGLVRARDRPIRLEETVRLTRTGRAMRLIRGDGRAATAEPDLGMLRMIQQGRKWWEELADGVIDIATLAARQGVTASWVVRIVRLAFLAPEITEMLVRGAQPAHVDGKLLTASDGIALRWPEQLDRISANA